MQVRYTNHFCNKMSIKTETKPKIEEVLDLDLDLDFKAGPSVEYYHGCLGVTVAERRLKDHGQDGAYLLRESDVKQNMFIISSINDSSVTHLVVPNSNGRFLQQAFEKASLLIEDVVRSCEGYLHPVPPLGPNKCFNEIHSKQWTWNKCYCCSFTNEDIKVRADHQKCHKLEKCDQCSKYMRKGSMQRHKEFCNTKPENQKKYTCNSCSYETLHYNNLWLHKKGHKDKPFPCTYTYKYKFTEENCLKRFKTEEELRQHLALHTQGFGFQCEECGKKFNDKFSKPRHMKKVHQQPNPRDLRPKGRNYHRCELCPFKSTMRSRLAIHIDDKHTVKEPKTHDCKFCDYKAGFAYLLKKHLKSCKKIANKPIIISMIGYDTICMQ